MYEGVQSEVLSTTRFDENSNLTMTYLGRIDMTRASKVKAEEKFPISEQGYMEQKLLDGTDTFRHGHKQIIYVQVTLFKMQIFIFITEIFIQNSKSSSRKWMICWCVVYYTSSNRHTWS